MSTNISEQAGFSTQRLDALTQRMQGDVQAGRIPGVVMLVACSGRIAYQCALGAQAPGSGTPMAMDSIFRIYSMTKPIVSVAAMMLVEQGRLLLSDPITAYLPELSDLKVGVERHLYNGSCALELEPALRPITVHDLLRHTSGFTYAVFGDSMVKKEYREAGLANPCITGDEFIRTLARVPLMYQPGTVWEYGHSTDVLGLLLERVTGLSLDHLLRESIFDRLGMDDTGFWVEPARQGRVAEPFDLDPITQAPVRLLPADRPPASLSGGGGLLSTARDYLRFASLLAGHGELDGVRLLSPHTLQSMTSDHLAELPGAKGGADYLPGPGYGFGLGFAVRTLNGALIPGSLGDYGWSGLAGTYFWVDPKEKLVAMLMMQAPEQRSYYRQLFRNMVYAALAGC